jgi:antitoxin component YwqK of YwqJK toxin-antitoxin module
MYLFRVRIHICLLLGVFSCSIGNAQHTLESDSIVLITNLDRENELFLYRGEPYTGEAFFLRGKDDQPMVMRSYVSGVQEGVWRTWHSNGRLYKEGEVKLGKEHGRYLEYFENGLLRYEYFYDSGKKTGLWRSWYENGNIYTERHFKNNTLDGRLVHYSEEGEVLVTEDYRNGRVVSTTRNQKD